MMAINNIGSIKFIAIFGMLALLATKNVQSQSISKDELQKKILESTITVFTGRLPEFPTPPSFCLVSNCDKSKIELAVHYTDSDELEKSLKNEMLDKYFFYKGDPGQVELTKPKRVVSINTVYLGSAEGYKEFLTKNTIEMADRDAKNKSARISGVVTFIATRGNVVGNGTYSNVKAISDKEVAALPADPKMVIVTNVTFGIDYGKRLIPLNNQEVLTAAYDEINEEQLRLINFAEGVRRVVRLIE